MSKVACLYSPYFMKAMYDYCIKQDSPTCVDQSDTLWYKQDLEHILVTEFGYIKSESGVIV